MLTSLRRAAAWFAAASLTALALGACSGDGDFAASASATAPAPASASAPPSPTASAADGTSSNDPSDDPARWAGTERFVQIDAVWTRQGRTYLAVRSARKVAATGDVEAWRIVPGRGPCTTVSLAPEGRVLLSVPLGDDSAPRHSSSAGGRPGRPRTGTGSATTSFST